LTTGAIFDGFTLAQRQRAAEAGWDQAAEQYRSTVVTTFQNVADALQAVKLDGESRNRAEKATRAARDNLCLTVSAFVGYHGESEPKNAQLNPKYIVDESEKEEVRRLFSKWWESVCKPYSKLFSEWRLEEPLTEAEEEASRPSGIDVLTSEQLYLTTRLSLVIAKATQYTDVVALFQALGGGWWNRSDVEEAKNRVLFAGTRSRSLP
jgi:Outer membrane efflux protein